MEIIHAKFHRLPGEGSKLHFQLDNLSGDKRFELDFSLPGRRLKQVSGTGCSPVGISPKFGRGFFADGSNWRRAN